MVLNIFLLLLKVNARIQRIKVHNGINVRGAKIGVFNIIRSIPQDKKDILIPTNDNIFLYNFILYVVIENNNIVINIAIQYDIVLCVI